METIMSSAVEKTLLEMGLKTVQSAQQNRPSEGLTVGYVPDDLTVGPGETGLALGYATDELRVGPETTAMALESLRTQGYLVDLAKQELSDADVWGWFWDADMVLAWGEDQEPAYRFLGLQWDDCDDSPKPTDLPWVKAESVIGKYTVKQARSWADETDIRWRWHAPRLSVQFCDSLEHGQALCQAHFLKALIDGGAIERIGE